MNKQTIPAMLFTGAGQVPRTCSKIFCEERKGYLIDLDRSVLLNLWFGAEVTGAYDMPVIEPYPNVLPTDLVPFSQLKISTDSSFGVHFFVHDARFLRVMRSPERYTDMLKRMAAVICPDFSQYIDMPFPLKVFNCWLNKALGAYWQKRGVPIIANATWSGPDSYSYCFDGLPSACTIAVSSLGSTQSSVSRYLWRKGYEEMLQRLRPSRILRYGPRMPDEYEEISVYYDVKHLKRMHEYGK